MHVPHPVAGVAEYQRAGCLIEAQHIDHRVFDLIGGHADGSIGDVAMRLITHLGIDPQSVLLIAPR